MNQDFQSKLTAWALKELPPEEQTAVEAALAEQPEARAYAEDTRAFCALLQEAVGVEAELTAEQREALIRQLSAAEVPTPVVPFAAKRQGYWWLVGGPGAAAAAGLALWAGGWWKGGEVGAGTDVAQRMPAPRERGAVEVETQARQGQGMPSLAVVEDRQQAASAAPLVAAAPPAAESVAQKEEAVSRLAAAAPAAANTPNNWSYDGVAAEASETLDARNRAGAALADASGVVEELRAPAAERRAEPADAGRPLPGLAWGRERFEATAAPESVVPERAAVRFVPPAQESYEDVPENPFTAVPSAPLSTFSIDVDTAAYANVRRFLNQGQRPPRAAVRLEELVNYFRYDYPPPAGEHPFSVTVDIADCPWQPHHRLARIGLKGKEIVQEERPAANLVFLIDVSGSMDEPHKLPLLKQSLLMLLDQLKASDTVALVTYAGQSGVALPATSCEQKDVIRAAIEALTAGGSTNGASGIGLAYQTARQQFKPGGVNRVLLATDGDFNVGLTDRQGLQELITREAKSGVFLTVLGFGMGNLKDSTMEMLADKGNGHYAYIDSLSEARKVLHEQLHGSLVTIAKDVKIQVEFNPAVVSSYRLLGYENRLLAKQDFNDDRKDAGEIGAGHTVTAFYELVPVGAPTVPPPVDPLKYQPAAAQEAPAPKPEAASGETMTVKLRYKAPDGEKSQLLEVPVTDTGAQLAASSPDFQFAASVAMFGLLLKDSAYKGEADWEKARQLALAGKGPDPEGWRGEFIQLLEKARGVTAR